MDEKCSGACPVQRPVTLPEWAERREAGRRLVVHAWCLLAGVTLSAALLSQRLLLAPAGLALLTLAVVGGGVLRTRWWRWRRRAVGHPMARAAAPRSLARGRPQPPGWPEALVVGSVHVTDRGWRWVPSVFVTDDVAPCGWRHADIVGLSFVPSWGPWLPRCGYLRLLLADAPPVDLLVWDPDLLGLLLPLPEEESADSTGARS